MGNHTGMERFRGGVATGARSGGIPAGDGAGLRIESPSSGDVGSIPARAGPTRTCGGSGRSPRAHPRGCGADSTVASGITWHQGASPRVRGRLLRAGRGPELHGSIPAGAGPTRRPTCGAASGREHPRGCGADDGVGEHQATRVGASPRVRGRRAGPARGSPGGGSIPAGAGPTENRRGRGPRRREHPRGCGADQRQLGTGLGRVGASPRVRGRRGGGRGPDRVRGSIPAGAGPTQTVTEPCAGRTEHPRGCGADSGEGSGISLYGGASPRVRGRRLRVRVAGGLARSIPAGAGPTPRDALRLGSGTGHPRGCGADHPAAAYGAALVGASPRVRGRPALPGHALRQLGSIPAGAGPTRRRGAPCR